LDTVSENTAVTNQAIRMSAAKPSSKQTPPSTNWAWEKK